MTTTVEVAKTKKGTDGDPAQGRTGSQTLDEVIRRTIGSWVGGTIRRRPMIIPVVIEA